MQHSSSRSSQRCRARASSSRSRQREGGRQVDGRPGSPSRGAIERARCRLQRRARGRSTRGQFIAANLLAQHLGSKNSSITTQAVLDGLNSGKNISTTLESLGLSPSEATDAQRAANRELREAERQSAASSKATSETKPDQDKPNR